MTPEARERAAEIARKNARNPFPAANIRPRRAFINYGRHIPGGSR